MVNYTCYRCNYMTDHRGKIKYHLNRKIPCSTIKLNVEILNISKSVLEGKTFEEYKVIQQKYKIAQESHKTAQESHKTAQESHKTAQKMANKIIKCIYCDKIYSRTSSLSRHLLTCKEKEKDEDVKDSMNKLVVLLNEQLNEKNQQLCKKDEQLNDFKKEIKKEFKKELTKRDNELKKELIKKDEQLKKQNKQIDELIKKAGINISTTNVMNNIKLLSYSETDRSHLTDKDIIKCLKHSNFCIPHLIEKIHFDKNKPQNHNVYISNLKNKYIMIYDGNKWVCKDRDEQLMNLIDDNEGIFEYKIEEWIENGNKFPKMMKKFNTYVGIKDNNMVINKIKDEIKLLLYNNRNVVNKDLFLENK